MTVQTDTASVLLEAMQYIRFLHEQVKVCIHPAWLSLSFATIYYLFTNVTLARISTTHVLPVEPRVVFE